MSSEDDARLKQFEMLWAEISRRSSAQQALLALNVTTTGAVGGLTVTGRADAVLLVVLAVTSPVFGLLWIDHASNIGDIGAFIRREWKWTPSWEIARHEAKNSSWARYVFFITAMAMVFVVPAVAGLIASWPEADSLGSRTAWVFAAILTALLVVGLVAQVWRSRPGH